MKKIIIIFSGILFFFALFSLFINKKSSSVSLQNEDEYFYNMIKKMSELSDKKPFICDAPNEGYVSLQKYRPSLRVTNYIVRNWEALEAHSLVSNNLLLLMGEIHSNTSVNVLLAYYLKHAASRTAISLAACLDVSQIENALGEINKAGLLDRFLKGVLPKKEFESLKDKKNEERMRYFIEHFDDIKKSAIGRSKPMLG